MNSGRFCHCWTLILRGSDGGAANGRIDRWMDRRRAQTNQRTTPTADHVADDRKRRNHHYSRQYSATADRRVTIIAKLRQKLQELPLQPEQIHFIFCTERSSLIRGDSSPNVESRYNQ